MAKLLHIDHMPEDPESDAIARLANYLNENITVSWIAAYRGQAPEMVAHDIANLGSGVAIRIAGMAKSESARSQAADGVALSVDFLVGAASINGYTAARNAAVLAWQIREKLIHQLVAVPWLVQPWQFDSTVPWLETETVHVKSMILNSTGHLHNWQTAG